MSDRAPGTVAVLLKGYPRLSETFIAQELYGLEQAGLALRLYAMRRPTDKARHPVHAEIAAPVEYLPEYLYQEPARVWRAWRKARRLPGYAAARRAFLADWRRDRTPNRGRRFGQALVLAAELPADVRHLHVHFLHTPASVARYAAGMTGLRWTVSAHAKDIWTSPDWEKAEKLADCGWLVTCTRVGAAHLAAIAQAHGLPDDRVSLVYHGLDLSRFPTAPPLRPMRDGRDPDDPVQILSVGRLVAKKGYDDLLAALARLPAAVSWRLVHIGGGSLKDALRARAQALGIADRIEWRGAVAQAAVIDACRAADLFALACKVADDGDRDGLPNALMEAGSQGLACLSTTVSAIPELIADGRNGTLVAPGDPTALARALERLIGDPLTRLSHGRALEATVRERFSFAAGVADLAQRLGPQGAGQHDAAA